jgi:hypothetical protein
MVTFTFTDLRARAKTVILHFRFPWVEFEMDFAFSGGVHFFWVEFRR